MTAYPVNHLEILASDPNAAAEFYSRVFGWKIEVEETMNYVQFTAEEGGIGGAFTQVDENNPAARSSRTSRPRTSMPRRRRSDQTAGRPLCPRRRSQDSVT